MPKFETVVDDVLTAVHDAIKEHNKTLSRQRLEGGVLKRAKADITEEYYRENREALRKYLKQELNELLYTKCDVEFLQKYIKYSGRYFIKNYKNFGPMRRNGGYQLATFLEAKIDYVLQDNSDLQNKEDVKRYLLNKKLIDPKASKENKSDDAVTEEVKEELTDYLLSDRVNHFWINREKQIATLLEQEQITKEQEQNELQSGSVKLTTAPEVKVRQFYNDKCDWYENEDPLKLYQIIRQIESLCEFYIKNRYAKLRKLQALLPKECELKQTEERKEYLSFAIKDSESNMQLPSEFEFDANHVDKNKNPIFDEVKTVTAQYNKMQQLRHMLHSQNTGTAEKINLFRNAYMTDENQAILNKDIDGPLKRVLFVLSNLITGQFFLRGTFKFWQTDSQIIGDIITRYDSPKSIVRDTKVVSDHVVASPRNRSR